MKRIPTWVRDHRHELICALLLSFMGLNLLSVLSRKNLTLDETLLIPDGYYSLHGDFRFNPEHPPLVKLIAALPLLLIDTQAPALEPEREYWEYRVAQDFWKANKSHYELATFLPRLPMIAISLLLGMLIFVFARRLFGNLAALLAVGLYSIEPTVLAHGRVVQTDLPSALTYLLVSFMLFFYLQSPTYRRAVFLGVSAGVALVTKLSMIALAPVMMLPLVGLFLFAPKFHQKRAPVATQLCIALLLTVLVVNAAYFFRRPAPHPYEAFVAATGGTQSNADPSGYPARVYASLQHIIPSDVFKGMSRLLVLKSLRSPAGLLGMYSESGWWYYFPVAFALKTTIPFLLLSIASIVWGLWALIRKREDRFLCLLVPLISFASWAMMSGINIGIRHFLPVFPFLFILGGAFLAALFSLRKRLLSATVVLLLGWMSFEAIRTYPDYISHMNQFASSKPHWYYLSDSNLEWGDDIKALARYLHERGEDKVSAKVWGFEILEFYGIQNVPASSAAPGATPVRYVAVGASFLNGSVIADETDRKSLDTFRQLQPEKVFGGSIYLYRVKE